MQNENIKEKEGDATVYEVSFLFLPSLATEQVPAKVAILREGIEKAGGAMISGEEPVLIDLSYQMTKVVGTTRHKCNSGYFGWVKFEMPKSDEAGGITEVKKNLDANDDVLRYIIIKTVRENTLLNGKMMLRKEEAKRHEDGEVSDEIVDEVEPAKEVAVADVAELDKSIDEMVVA